MTESMTESTKPTDSVITNTPTNVQVFTENSGDTVSSDTNTEMAEEGYDDKKVVLGVEWLMSNTGLFDASTTFK